MGAVRGRYWMDEGDDRSSVHPWPRLVREVASAYQAESGEALSALDDSTPGPDDDAPAPDDEVFTLGERCAEAYMQADARRTQKGVHREAAK